MILDLMVLLKALEQKATVLLHSVPVFPKALSDCETLSVGLAARRHRNKLQLIERWLFRFTLDHELKAPCFFRKRWLVA